MTSGREEHLDRIRDRFTRTAVPFARFALTARAEESARLAASATANFTGAESAVAADLGCGPGTFTVALAARVGGVTGVDLTPAMLAQARETARRAGLTNTVFVCANADALPFADGALEMTVCGYALHHLLAPERAIGEMARVVHPGGRVAIVDMILPEEAHGETHDRIERSRDPSHTATLRASTLRSLVERAGLRVREAEQSERRRDFDHWMGVAGWAPGSETYEETRRMMEAAISGDETGFAARRGGDGRGIEFRQMVFSLVAEK